MKHEWNRAKGEIYVGRHKVLERKEKGKQKDDKRGGFHIDKQQVKDFGRANSINRNMKCE